MSQRLLPFKYEQEKKEKNLTGLGGLLLYLELFKALKLDVIIKKTLKIKEDKQGWRDDQIIIALILLNLVGGESVSDIQQLEKDGGFCRILQSLELRSQTGRSREKIRKRWRIKCKNKLPSPSSIFRYLAYFHDEEQEDKRVTGVSYIPRSNRHLSKLSLINNELVSFIQKVNPIETATLDMDATFIESYKSTALKCYKSYTAYSSFNVWWHEHDVLLHTEFRDGNVSPGHGQLRLLKESVQSLPEGVKKVYIRSDAAGYQNDLLKYCNRGENERFGRIGFAIGCGINDYFKEAILSDKDLEWHKMYMEIGGLKIETGQEWADVCYVPYNLSRSKKDKGYRFIATRERLNQRILPGIESQMSFPFPTIKIKNEHYKIRALVTNLEWEPEKIIHWYRQRCGKSEQVHSVMKNDFAGGRLPSSDFGENAAWWWIMILSMNLDCIMKKHVLGKEWKEKRMKAIRFNIINLPARIIIKRRKYVVKIPKGYPLFDLLELARKRMWEFSCLPAG